MKVIGYGKAREEDIVAYEQKYGCKLPEDYRQFLLEFNGGMPETEHNHLNIKMNQKMGVYRFNWITRGGEARKSIYNLNDNVTNLGALIQPKYFIPFASMDMNLLLILSTKEDMPGIYIYDFLKVLKETKKIPFHKVCDTFTEFLELIVPDEQ